MIDHAWKWAAENNKLHVNVVNGAEYADLPVDRTKKKTDMSEQSWRLRAQTTIEDRTTF